MQGTPRFAFGPRNYRLMFAGLAVLAVGFITMTLDTADYGEGFLGITLGPVLLLLGFLIEFWAIMAKPRGSAPIAQDAATHDTLPQQPAPTAPSYKRP